MDPYSPQSVVELWPKGAIQFQFLAKDLADGSLLAKRGIPTAYPPSCLVMLTPLAVLSWPVANLVWTLISVSLFFVMLWGLVSHAGLLQDKTLSLGFIAASFALAPFHTGIATGNPAVVAAEAGVIAFCMVNTGSGVMSALLLALSCGLKPQIGLLFLAYFLVRRRWRIVGLAAAILFGLVALAWLRLQWCHVPWMQSYIRDNQALFSSGILGDFRPANPTRFGLLNLQLVFHPLVKTATQANALAVAVSGVMFALWLLHSRSAAEPRQELLQLSTLSVFSLLPIYHRFYDAVLLILPLCWCFANGRDFRRTQTKLGLLFLVPFLLPGGSLLETLRDTGRIPPHIAASWWWNILVMPHAVWVLVLLAGVLLWEMRSTATRPTPQVQYVSPDEAQQLCVANQT